jgi:hypothetical protein
LKEEELKMGQRTLAMKCERQLYRRGKRRRRGRRRRRRRRRRIECLEESIEGEKSHVVIETTIWRTSTTELGCVSILHHSFPLAFIKRQI